MENAARDGSATDGETDVLVIDGLIWVGRGAIAAPRECDCIIDRDGDGSVMQSGGGCEAL